jgi:hypothetical protein
MSGNSMQIAPVVDHTAELRGQVDWCALEETTGEPAPHTGQLNDHEQRGQCSEQKPPAQSDAPFMDQLLIRAKTDFAGAKVQGRCRRSASDRAFASWIPAALAFA